MSIASTQSSPRRDTDRKSQQNFNENGELGPGLGIRAVDVCCGGFHTLVRMENGSVFAMGKQDFGILGTGTEKSMSIDIGAEAPVMVRYSPGSSGKSMVDTAKPVSALQISTGGWHTAIVSAQGELFMCGKGEYGRLGLGDEKARMGLTALSSSSTVLAADGTVTSKVSVPDLTVLMQSQEEEGKKGERAVAAAAAAVGRDKVVQVATGGSHTIWRTEGEHLFAVGRVDGGRLGVGYISEVSLAELTILNNTGKRSMDRLLHPIDITAMLHVDQAARFSSKGGIAESSSSAANYKILQVSAGGSHSAVLVDYPDITETGAEEDFLQAIDARIQAQESKVDPKRIPKVK
jgi:alpha-tubulin suppressor-like RCC1 family protein